MISDINQQRNSNKNITLNSKNIVNTNKVNKSNKKSIDSKNNPEQINNL